MRGRLQPQSGGPQVFLLRLEPLHGVRDRHLPVVELLVLLVLVVVDAAATVVAFHGLLGDHTVQVGGVVSCEEPHALSPQGPRGLEALPALLQQHLLGLLTAAAAAATV